jgi:hypothetical protein
MPSIATDPREICFGANRLNRSGAVYMAEYDVPAKASIRSHRSLEIHARTWCEITEVCHSRGLRTNLGGKGPRCMFNDGQADAVDRNAFTGPQI